MTAPNSPKLHTLPWPAWVGVSLLLHIGVLSFGLPQMLRVREPASSKVNIPVTLVDDDSPAPAAGSANAPQAVPPPSQPVPNPVPIGSQTTAVAPVQQTAVQPSNPSPASSRPDTPAQPPSEQVNAESTSQPTPQPPAESQPLPDDRLVDSQSEPQTRESSQETGDGPTEVTILKVGRPTDLGIETAPRPDSFALPSIFRIPRTHACQGDMSVNEIDLPVVVERDGSVSSAYLYSESTDANIKLADCLLIATVKANPTAMRFSPAIPNTDFAVSGEETVAAEIQLRLRFRAD